MASFFNKALEYLGLKELDDGEFYDEDEEVDAPARRPRRHMANDREPRLAADPVSPAAPGLRITGNPLRPVPLDESISSPSQTTSIIRPISTASSSYSTQPVVHIVTPQQFDSAQEIANAVKASKCVIVNLLGADKDLTRRLVDFCAGLTMGVDGKLERVTEQVFLLSPSNVTISNDERTRLQDRGFNGL
ncbi:MAG TPA: cell division protein SepF [Acidimicrobiales bacterium]|nr:cell division protein SepF [Acidimicrobiales bacterium]